MHNRVLPRGCEVLCLLGAERSGTSNVNQAKYQPPIPPAERDDTNASLRAQRVADYGICARIFVGRAGPRDRAAIAMLVGGARQVRKACT